MQCTFLFVQCGPSTGRRINANATMRVEYLPRVVQAQCRVEEEAMQCEWNVGYHC